MKKNLLRLLTSSLIGVTSCNYHLLPNQTINPLTYQKDQQIGEQEKYYFNKNHQDATFTAFYNDSSELQGGFSVWSIPVQKPLTTYQTIAFNNLEANAWSSWGNTHYSEDCPINDCLIDYDLQTDFREGKITTRDDINDEGLIWQVINDNQGLFASIYIIIQFNLSYYYDENYQSWFIDIGISEEATPYRTYSGGEMFANLGDFITLTT